MTLNRELITSQQKLIRALVSLVKLPLRICAGVSKKPRTYQIPYSVDWIKKFRILST